MERQFHVRKVPVWHICGLNKVRRILSACGEDMSQKYHLEHWHNGYLKNWAIVALCALRNTVYLVYDGEQAVATFQIKLEGKRCHPHKLGTDPRYGGKGVGSFCMLEIERIGREAGCDECRFEVYDQSEHALSFYLKRGYAIDGEVKTRKYREVVMQKKL